MVQDHDGTVPEEDPLPEMDDWETIPQNTQPPEEDPDPGSEIRGIDLPTGANDDSYKGGVKEDTPCPAESTGSIPNNKSDLRTFRVYEEAGTGGHPGFLNLGWSRVTDPSGTTLMDFEFNQSSTPCSVPTCCAPRMTCSSST